MIRTCSSVWLSAAAGRIPLTEVARSGPVVASATCAARHVGEVPGAAGPQVQRHRLDRVVGQTVEIAQLVGHVDRAEGGGVQVEQDEGRVSRDGAVERDRRMGQIELGDPARGDGVRVGPVGVDVERGARTVGGNRLGSTPVAVVRSSPRRPATPAESGRSSKASGRLARRLIVGSFRMAPWQQRATLSCASKSQMDPTCQCPCTAGTGLFQSQP
jgi:hypothetical protein